MTFLELQKYIASRLAECGAESPGAEARSIVDEITGKTPFPGDTATPEMLASIEKIIARRQAGEPLQYILNKAYFRELELYVAPGVLIPRPETELLAGFFIDELPEKSSFLDLGTGSGAIALSVAGERRDLAVTAVDVSADALAIARKNAALNHLEQVEFIESDLFAALGKRRFAGIAANLPYVTLDEYRNLKREVRDFEPELALTSGIDGLETINRCIDALHDFILPGGIVAFELSPHQAAKTAERLEKAGFQVAIVRDLTGRERFVRGVAK